MLITPYMIAVFYMVITVWLFGYLYAAVSGNLSQLADPNHFGAFINSNEIFVHFVNIKSWVVFFFNDIKIEFLIFDIAKFEKYLSFLFQ